jgi:hypothetical protein
LQALDSGIIAAARECVNDCLWELAVVVLAEAQEAERLRRELELRHWKEQ